MRVRIELTDRVIFSKPPEPLLKTVPVAEITLANDEGKITKRKHDLVLVGDDYPDVLQQIIGAIEADNDPSLRTLVERYKEAKHEARS